jgi:hypothetical protein
VSAYSTAVLADSPFDYWRCADPDGQIAYDLGSDHKALAARNYEAKLGYTGPISDGGAFYSTNQGPLWFLDAVAWAPPITLEVIYWQQMIFNRQQKIITLEASDLTYNGPSINIETSGKPSLASGGSTLVGANVASKQAWHHLVAVFTSSGRTLYMDAISQASDAVVMPSGNGYRSLGCRGIDLLAWCEGFISEAAVYKSALSPTRINAHFLAIDNVPSNPIYKGPGGSVGGVPVFIVTDVNSILTDVSAVLAAVQKTFPTT